MLCAFSAFSSAPGLNGRDTESRYYSLRDLLRQHLISCRMPLQDCSSYASCPEPLFQAEQEQATLASHHNLKADGFDAAGLICQYYHLSPGNSSSGKITVSYFGKITVSYSFQVILSEQGVWPRSLHQGVRLQLSEGSGAVIPDHCMLCPRCRAEYPQSHPAFP